MPSKSRSILIGFLCFACLTLMTACGGSGKTKFEPSATSYEEKFLAFSDGSVELRVRGASVKQDFFDGGDQPVVGRLFVKDEYRPEGRRVALISKEFWDRRFKSAPGIIGKAVTINGADYSVVGVLPASYNIPSGGEVWIPKF